MAVIDLNLVIGPIGIKLSLAACMALVLCGLFALVMTIKADGRIDYCQVVYYNENSVQPPVYIVEGHRSWRADVRLAVAASPDEAEAKLKTLCSQ